MEFHRHRIKGMVHMDIFSFPFIVVSAGVLSVCFSTVIVGANLISKKLEKRIVDKSDEEVL